MREVLTGTCHHCHIQARLYLVGGFALCYECQWLKSYQDAERALQKGDKK